MVAVAITKKRPQPCITLIPLPDMCAEEKEEEEEEEEEEDNYSKLPCALPAGVGRQRTWNS